MINVTDDNDLKAAYMVAKKITFFISEAESCSSDDDAELVKKSARKVTKETLQSFFEGVEEKKTMEVLADKIDDVKIGTQCEAEK